MTLTDKWISALKNNKFVAVLLIGSTVVVSATQVVRVLADFVSAGEEDLTGKIWKACGFSTRATDPCGVLVTGENGIIYSVDVLPANFSLEGIKGFKCTLRDGSEVCFLKMASSESGPKPPKMVPAGMWTMVGGTLTMAFDDGNGSSPSLVIELKRSDSPGLTFSGLVTNTQENTANILILKLIVSS